MSTPQSPWPQSHQSPSPGQGEHEYRAIPPSAEPDTSYAWSEQQARSAQYEPYPRPPYVAPKNPALHALVSLFVPGAGSMMAGEIGIGLAFLLGIFVAAPVFSVVTLGLGLILAAPAAFAAWIVSIWHAHQAATQWNRRHGIVS